MQTFHLNHISDDLEIPQGAVATLGVFDGVHLGHQKIIQRLSEVAADIGCPSIVLTFAVHPVVVVKGLPPRLITSLPHRLRLFESLGVDVCVVLPFDDEVRQMEAREFADQLFRKALNLRGLVLGPDARIGRDRKGDTDFLQQYCGEAGIQLEILDGLHLLDCRVSSTRIRAAIVDGDLERAGRMLGREFTLLGTVVRGDGRGRQLGFATANLNLHHEIRPPVGVYAVLVRVNGERHRGVLNIGVRPTFGPDGGLTVEAHLLDFSGDLYDRELEVVLVERLRRELRFESREDLIAQINKDIEGARALVKLTDSGRD